MRSAGAARHITSRMGSTDIDNETKYYDSVSNDMQRLFIKYLYEKFDGDLNELNHRFGLDYWSHRS